MKQKTGSFIASDKSGKKYKINIFTDILNADEFGGSQTRKGLMEFKTQDGTTVSVVGKGHYLIMNAEPLDIYSDAPDAP